MAYQDPIAPANLGVYLDRPAALVPARGLVDCLNARIKNGRVVNENMGWEKFMARQLGVAGKDRHVLLIDQFFERAGGQHLIFGTPLDLYRYDEGSEDVLFLTPRYETGTISVNDTDTTVTGVGTAWDTAPGSDPDRNAKAGDFIAFGAAGERDPDATWYEIDSITSDTELELVTPYSGSNLSGVAYTIRKTFTGDAFDIWYADIFPDAQPEDKDYWFATNGKDWVVRWDGAATQVERLFDLGFTCRSLTRYKNMMLYLRLTEAGDVKPQAIRNSSIAKPLEVDGSGESSEFVAMEGVDVLLDALKLGDTLVLYGDRSITNLQFVGSPLNFISRTAIDGIGILNGRAVMDFGDFHEFLATDSAFRFDGLGIEEVGGQVFREVLRKTDPNRLDQALAHIDEENGEVLWVIPHTDDPDPENGGPRMAYTEHYLESVSDKVPIPMMIRDLPATATGFFQRSDTLRFSDLPDPFSTYNFKFDDRFFAASFPFNLFGDENGFVYIFGTKDNQDGAAIESFARFGRRVLIDGNLRGLVHRIEPYAGKRPEAAYALKVRLRGADQADGPSALLAERDYDLTQGGNRFVNPRKVTRYAEVEFGTNGVNRPWEVAGYRMAVVSAGSR